jgi:small subunit ribosomal protein S15
MARMYSRKHGKSGSTKPTNKQVQTWVRYSAKEVELLITKVAKEGKTASQIGLTLRDAYGIPNVKAVTKKSITQILKEKKLVGDIPEDLLSLMKKNLQEKKHLESNHKDMVGKRGLQLTESKIRRLVKYYKRTGALSADWKYNPEKVRLLIG